MGSTATRENKMLNSIPVAGWILDLILKISLAVPFWLIWTVFGIGETYFYFLPEVYLRPGFWSCVGVFIVVPILKAIFIPKLVMISNDTTVKSGERKDPLKYL